MVSIFKQETQLPLRKQGVNKLHSCHHNATLRHTVNWRLLTWEPLWIRLL